MLKFATVFIMAMAGSASATDGFNVKLKFLRQGITITSPDGIFAPAADDNLGSSCDPFDQYGLGCWNYQCEQYDRSIDVFSDSLELQGLKDVTIDTTAPYAISVDSSNEVTLWVGETDTMWGGEFCTGYNGWQGSGCLSRPNVPAAIGRTFWNGGANPGAGGVGWGGCQKCSSCYASSDIFGQMSCDFICDGYDFNDPNILLAIQSAGTNAKNGVVVGLLCLALTSLSLFSGA